MFWIDFGVSPDIEWTDGRSRSLMLNPQLDLPQTVRCQHVLPSLKVISLVVSHSEDARFVSTHHIVELVSCLLGTVSYRIVSSNPPK